MEREKMIEELAMLLCKDICFRKICAVTNHCQIKNCKMREKATLLYYFIVKKYNDFLPEGAVVLTQEELAKHDEKVCKETVKEFAKNFENYLCDVNNDYCTDDTVPEALYTSAEIDKVMDRTLKDFGVEVE